MPFPGGFGLPRLSCSLGYGGAAPQPPDSSLQTATGSHPFHSVSQCQSLEPVAVAPVPTPCRNMMTQGMPNAWQTPPPRLTGDRVGSSEEGRASQGDHAVVPVEYATAKLWGVTSEYENLLNIQRDQHMLAVRQREAEVAHLRNTIEMLEQGNFHDNNIVARIKSKEQETSLAVQAKQKELELFTHLLQMRDRQIGDLQEMCQAKQAQLEQVHGYAQQAPRVELCDKDAFAKVFQETEALRREKTELEKLLLTKEKQMNAVQAVDPDLCDSSALQLGAQAIQMFHDSVRMKADVAANGQENQELRDEITRLQAVIVDLEATVGEKRGEIKEMTSTLTQKMQKVFELEAAVEGVRREGRQAATAGAGQFAKAQDEIDKRKHDHHASQQLVEELKAELSDRDQRISRQQEECTHQQATCQILQQKVTEMNAQLVQATEVMGQMLQTGNYKDQIVREMTEKATSSETQLLKYLMTEKLVARQDTGGGKDVVEPIDASALRFTTSFPKGSQREPVASKSREMCGRAVSSTFTPGVSVANAPDRACVGFQPYGGVCETEIERFLSPDDTPRSSQGASPNEPWSYSSQRRRHDTGHQATVSVSAHASLGSLSVPNYRPHPDDPIDAQVADFVNQKQFSACRALFCRLSSGSYLYGTQRVSLRVGSKIAALEALIDGDWIAVGEFVQRMQRSQGIHLQRAREAM